ncbi:MAG TPA: PEP-CTERM-box response regulator transcription factor [Gammaproteobacteria bacterium]|nr:PEP-CTERM-box response regulator transcription factor [Gammaproteobacteria bacterium]
MNDKNLKPLLVVEDNPSLQKQLKWAFNGYEVHVADTRESAIEQLKRYRPHVVTLDLGLPPDTANASEGIAALEQILQLAPHTKVIVVTGNDAQAVALKTVSLGAYDFYQKPVNPEVLALMVDRASKLYDLEAENRRLLAERSGNALDGIIYASAEMQEVCRMIEKVAPTNVTTLITGESGTGKELVARALHGLSSRRSGPFVAVNCAAIPETLLESELFGYEKGAFTGAVRQNPGKIEYASGGTFFLDEIGDMPMSLQSKMLRFLQDHEVERLGGHKQIPVDVRVLCATHRDLKDLIRTGAFREDLYYRISEIVIHIPALRERPADRLLLARSFLEKYARENGRRFRGFSGQACEQIEAYGWPGNVREMENRIKRSVVMAEGNTIIAQDLGLQDDAGTALSLSLRAAREEAERKVIQRALDINNYNMSHSAEALGISRPSLYNLMKKLDMEGIDRS